MSSRSVIMQALLAVLLLAVVALGADEPNTPTGSGDAVDGTGAFNSLVDPFSKRRSNFLPSRGKKEAPAEGPKAPSGDDSSATQNDFLFDPEMARLQFLERLSASKRAGFLPMRGRKSLSEDFLQDEPEDESLFLEGQLDALNGLAKRRVQSFMPMRGRKYDRFFPRFFTRTAFPFKTGNAVFDLENVLTSGGLSQKRKGMGFFGARGKR